MKRSRDDEDEEQDEDACSPAKSTRLDSYEPPPSPLFEEDAHSLSYLRRRFRQNPNPLHSHPRDARITIDLELHRYMVDGTETYESMTSAGSHFHSVYDPEQTVKRIMTSVETPGTKSKYRGMSKDEVRAKLDGASPLGTKRHAHFEALLNGEELTPEQVSLLEEIGGFRRWLADHPTFHILRTEWMMFDETAKIAGTCDARFAEALVDWKNCGLGTIVPGPKVLKQLIDLGVLIAPGRIYSHPEEEAEEIRVCRAYDDAIKERKLKRAEKSKAEAKRLQRAKLMGQMANPPILTSAEIDKMMGPEPPLPACYSYHDPSKDKTWGMCPHPLMQHLPDVKAVTYARQMNGYDWLEARGYQDWREQHPILPEGTEDLPLIIVNFPPERPHAYEMFLVKRNHALTRAIFDLFPWNVDDVRHFALDPARELLVPRLSPADSRGDGPTRVKRVEKGDIPPGHVWTEGAWTKPGYNLAASHWALESALKVFKPFPMSDAQRKIYVKKLVLAARVYEGKLLKDRARLEELVPMLYGRTLLCWCPEDDEEAVKHCHARCLARYANALGQGRISIKPEEEKES